MIFAQLYSSMQKIISIAWAIIIEILSPACCYYCKKYLKIRALFCDTCSAKLHPVVSIELPITTTKSVKVFAASAYTEPIKHLIIAKSWSDSIASAKLADLIVENTIFKTVPCDYIIPIPLHWTRRIQRGYNQADIIAQCLSKNNTAQVSYLLKRTKRTLFQSKLTPELRMKNLHEAFTLSVKNPALFANKHLILVDDLMTTGATLRSAAKVLFQLKPASITVIVAARVI